MRGACAVGGQEQREVRTEHPDWGALYEHKKVGARVYLWRGNERRARSNPWEVYQGLIGDQGLILQYVRFFPKCLRTAPVVRRTGRATMISIQASPAETKLISSLFGSPFPRRDTAEDTYCRYV